MDGDQKIVEESLNALINLSVHGINDIFYNAEMTTFPKIIKLIVSDDNKI